MFAGQSAPGRDFRPQFIDLNLVPLEFRPRPFPILTVGLSVLLVGCAVLLYAIFYAKTYTDLEIDQLGSRVAQAQTVVVSATGDPAALAHQEQLRALRDDFKTLVQRQINWGDVFQVVGDVPDGVIVKSASQTGYGVTVTGSAINQAAAATYLDRLKNSGLFVDSAIQVGPASGPVSFGTNTPVPTRPIAPPPRPPAVLVVPPTQPPAPVPTPVVQEAPTPVPARQAAPLVPTKVPPPPTITPTPTITLTDTVTPEPTPQYDFAILSVHQVPWSNRSSPNSDIKGTIVDTSGNVVPGYQVEIDSEGQPPWSSLSPPALENGTFDFNVSHGKFTVYVLGGNAEQATGLYTGANGANDTYGYVITFQKTFQGSVPVGPTVTTSSTPTPTDSPTPSPSPVAPGANVASLGCATGYLVQNGVSKPLANAGAAIDGNLGSEWNSETTPNSGTQVIWQWSLPEPGQTPPPGCAGGAGLSDANDQIDGFQLIPDQNSAGTTDHELWLYSDPGCNTNVKTDGTAYFTWQQYTVAGQILPLRIEPGLAVRCVIVRTISDPSVVAWEEMQIFQELPAPGGFPALTGTVTSTPSITPTASGSTTATITPTTTATTTLTSTPTATFTPLPPVVGGENIAPFASTVTTSSGTGGANVIDNNPSTFWVPLAGLLNTQSVTVQLASTCYTMGSATPVGSDALDDIRVLVKSAGTGGQVGYLAVLSGPVPPGTPGPGPILGTYQSVPASAQYPDFTQIDFPIAPPVFGAASVSVYLYPTGTEDGSYGLRELQVFKTPPGSTDCAFPPTGTVSPTPTRIVTSPSPTFSMVVRQPARASSGPSLLGRGRGPGDAPLVATPIQSPPAAANAQPTPTPTPGAAVGGAVDFTIILEVGSGSGYP